MADLLPPQNLIELVGSLDIAHFQAVGDAFLDIFIKYGGLKRSDRVLDVGCGSGRMALPLSRYLTTGSYEGFDISREAIEWCQTNITARFPNFRFTVSEVTNRAYGPEVESKASTYRFPYRDRSFDLTFLASVFTHLLPEDLENYAREVARTLKPAGKAIITCFLLNDESERLMKSGASQIVFSSPLRDGPVRVRDAADPEAAIAYPESMIRGILEASGLTLMEPIYFGSWCGRKDTVTVQDLTILRRERRIKRLVRKSLSWMRS